MNWNGVSYIGNKARAARNCLPSGPVSGAVPSLLRDAKRDERQLNLVGLKQLEIFHRPFGRARNDGQAELAGQQLREPLAISVIGAAGRCGADHERLRPIRLVRDRPPLGTDRKPPPGSRRSGAVRPSYPASHDHVVIGLRRSCLLDLVFDQYLLGHISLSIRLVVQMRVHPCRRRARFPISTPPPSRRRCRSGW